MAAGLIATSLAQAAPPPGPLHLAIGMFDGVHLGHQAVVEAAIHSAKQSGGVAAVLTFHPHPSRLFRPEAPTLLLMPPEQKTRFLHELGVDLVITQPFTRAFARITAEAFLGKVKRYLPALAAIYVGENFRFGRGRAGDVETLVRSGRKAGVAVVSVARLRRNGRAISSTWIRELLAMGEIAEASRLLGYTYFCEGLVQAGRRLGRKLGFPTLNLAWAPEARPAYGVYAVRLYTEESSRGRPGVANYGLRPTVARTAGGPLLETHLLGTKQAPGPGQKIRVEWREFLRAEQKFASLEALRTQIAKDKKAAAGYFRKK
jgi:riboflavin kinase/FMN adenylyltransferase